MDDTPRPPKLAPARARIGPILDALARLYPDAACELNFTSPLELLVATILSAQCTDKRVNLVTPALFQRYRTAKDYAEAVPAELQGYIKTAGFFRAKARSIQGCCRMLVDRHGGNVPATLAELIPLPGVGRKTANVVLGDAFGVPGITVDTHVGRLSRRLGLTRHTDPVKAEFALMELVPQPEWTTFSHRVILHGRRVCAALKPNCGGCTLRPLCPRVGVKVKPTVPKPRVTRPKPGSTP